MEIDEDGTLGRFWSLRDVLVPGFATVGELATVVEREGCFAEKDDYLRLARTEAIKQQALELLRRVANAIAEDQLARGIDFENVGKSPEEMYQDEFGDPDPSRPAVVSESFEMDRIASEFEPEISLYGWPLEAVPNQLWPGTHEDEVGAESSVKSMSNEPVTLGEPKRPGMWVDAVHETYSALRREFGRDPSPREIYDHLNENKQRFHLPPGKRGHLKWQPISEAIGALMRNEGRNGKNKSQE